MEENKRLDIFKTYEEFEVLIAEILKFNGFTVKDVSRNRDIGYDLDITKNGKEAIVEIKIQRNKKARIDLVKRACQQLFFVHKNRRDTIPLLIISSSVNKAFKNDIFKNYGIVIWDIRELFALVIHSGDLYYKLEEFLFKLFGEPVEEYSVVDTKVSSTLIQDFLNTRITDKEGEIIELKGKQLCSELSDIDPGRADFSKFEKKCTEILQYLFNNDLELWKDQNSTLDGLHRFDLLCRVRPSGKNFWEEILHDFKSRYIIFEYKNYSDVINQGEIYTTEKYLFTTALRSVAFIIAKNDGHVNSYKAASGALKEAGKLIVIISAKDLCKMLDMKDNGVEPAELLRAKIDDLLITMSR